MMHAARGRLQRTLVRVALAAGLLLTSAQLEAQRPPGVDRDRYLVLLDRRLGPHEALPVTVTRRFSLLPVLAVRANPQALAALARHPRVRVIEPDRGGQGHLPESQALIGVDSVRSLGFRGAGIKIAIVDSGIDVSHPDLAGSVVAEACFCSRNGGCCPDGSSEQLGPGSAMDDNGHGTHVASVIASQGELAGIGGAPDVSIVSIKVLDGDAAFGGTSDLSAALDWIAMHHSDVGVVNMSLGTAALYSGDCSVPNFVLGTYIDALRDDGTLVVASSGNDGSDTSMPAPACIASTISVGAVWDADVGARSMPCSDPVTAADRIACFSNASPITDLLAPGGLVHAAWPGGGVVARAGTSQAAPMVSACIAALLTAKPDVTIDTLEATLKATGTGLLDARNGATYPRVDCAAALDALVPPAGTADAAVPDYDAGMEDAGSAADAASPFDAGPNDAGGNGEGDASSFDSGLPHDAGADRPGLADSGVGSDPGMPLPMDGRVHEDASADVPDGRGSDSDAAVAARAASADCSCPAPGAGSAPGARAAWLSALALLGWFRRRGA